MVGHFEATHCYWGRVVGLEIGHHDGGHELMEALGHSRWAYAKLRGHLLPLEPLYEEHPENDGRPTVT